MAEFAQKGKLQIKGVPVCGYFNDNGNFSLDTFRIYEVTQLPDNPDMIQVELPPMDEGEFHCTLQLVGATFTSIFPPGFNRVIKSQITLTTYCGCVLYCKMFDK